MRRANAGFCVAEAPRLWLGVRLGRFSAHHVGFAASTERAYVCTRRSALRRTIARWKQSWRSRRWMTTPSFIASAIPVRHPEIPLSPRDYPSRIARPWRYMQHAHATISVLRPTRSRSTASYGAQTLSTCPHDIGPGQKTCGRRFAEGSWSCHAMPSVVAFIEPACPPSSTAHP
ncbi:uncharacterized protein TRAVEDRAFT_61276 [Trametes versicolor FP-101664 SS1]|uniref:uncharacterized protein n=1 Tax=Trametes versicolor (strain FP-101664) TaxID=717944 RepID=UPI0004623F76|nr:uncharacterized protein TRAVEDRAFT_61276 [Trametes versicolor FP-101664 SS1]EIW52254.1 hypothetical protein TRAVEDRAFT_61276 [Trametes versicolor FP-101664 SS1]